VLVLWRRHLRLIACVVAVVELFLLGMFSIYLAFLFAH